MTINQFDVLTEEQQGNVLWEKGVHIATKETLDHTLAIYQIDNFYVEVYYDWSSNYVKRFRSFDSPSRLQSYLEGIETTEIL